jgi:hypothetical protein
VHDRNRERQSLADAERQVGRTLVEIVAEPEPLHECGDALPAMMWRQVE